MTSAALLSKSGSLLAMYRSSRCGFTPAFFQISRVRSSPINPTDTLQAVRNAKNGDCTRATATLQLFQLFHAASGLYPFFPTPPHPAYSERWLFSSTKSTNL